MNTLIKKSSVFLKCVFGKIKIYLNKILAVRKVNVNNNNDNNINNDIKVDCVTNNKGRKIIHSNFDVHFST
jgi:RecA/RadA recombinase